MSIPFLLNTLVGGLVAGVMGVGTCLLILQIEIGFQPVPGGLTSLPEVQKVVWIVFGIGLGATVAGILGIKWIEEKGK